MTNAPLATIIIRAHNQESALRRLRPILDRQQLDGTFEVLLLDHESHDASAALASDAGWQYQYIPAGGFNYASSLNQGVFLARGQYCVSLSVDCLPQSDQWLMHLLAPLCADPNVVASYGPHSGAQNATTSLFSNTNSAFRREAVLRHPFNPVVKIHEDVLFALELADDEHVAYVPAALVQREAAPPPMRQAVRRWQREGWARFFISQQRGYPLPADLGAGQASVLRSIVQAAGYAHALLRRNLIARLDNQHEQRVAQALRRAATGGIADTPLDWTEELQLKADWGFIRKNIAEFIRDCHIQGQIYSPILEIGASGQNDYLSEWYTMNTSNLATNMQGASIPLDMEDMASIATGSYGTVLCSEVIEHVQHPDRAIQEAFRILRPGGTLILTTPYHIVVHGTPDDGGFHGRNFTAQGLELVVREAGFEIVRLETRGKTPTRQRLMPSNVFVVGQKPDDRVTS